MLPHLSVSFMKIFNTRAKDIVHYCMEMFNVQTPHHAIIKRKCKHLYNVMSSANSLCVICQEFTEKEQRGYLADYV